MDIQKVIEALRLENGIEITGKPKRVAEFFEGLDVAMSAMEELQQYRERIEQLKHAEVIQFRCKLPDGRICHFSDFIKFLEKGEVD